MAELQDVFDAPDTATRATLGVGETYVPPTPFTNPAYAIAPQNFAERVFDVWKLNPTNSAIAAGLFWLTSKRDPNFDPLAPENIKGYEPYASQLANAMSAEHIQAIKNQIDANNAARARISQNGGLVSSLVAGFLDPLNYVAAPVGVVTLSAGAPRRKAS